MPRLLSSALVAAALVPTFALAAPPAERPRLAVLGLNGTGVDPTVTQSLTGLLGTEITRLERYEVIGEDDVKGLVAAASLAQALGCDGPSCAADFASIGKTLSAGFLVVGSIGKVGEAHILNLTLLDARTSAPVNRTSATVKQLSELATSLRSTVFSLFGIAGQIVLWNQPEGAQVFLNEKFIGTTPVKKIDLPREGEFGVRVYRDDATPFETTVTVKAGEIARVRVESDSFADLDAAASSRRTWGGGLLAGGALALAGGGALYFLALQNDARLDVLDARKPADVALGREIASTSTGYVIGAAVAGLGGLALAGTGGYLLANNPHQRKLDAFTFVPTPGGAMLAVRF